MKKTMNNKEIALELATADFICNNLTYGVHEIVNFEDYANYLEHEIKIFVFISYNRIDGIVWAEHLQDALDVIVDSDEDLPDDKKRFNQHKIDPEDLDDYDPDYMPNSLGCYGEYYDLDAMDFIEVKPEDLDPGLLALSIVTI